MYVSGDAEWRNHVGKRLPLERSHWRVRRRVSLDLYLTMPASPFLLVCNGSQLSTADLDHCSEKHLELNSLHLSDYGPRPGRLCQFVPLTDEQEAGCCSYWLVAVSFQL